MERRGTRKKDPMLAQTPGFETHQGWDKFSQKEAADAAKNLLDRDFLSPSREPFKLSTIAARAIAELLPKCLPADIPDDDTIWLLQWFLDPALREGDHIVAIHPEHILDILKSRPRADWCSVGVRILTVAGPRLCEPRKMEESQLVADYISWQPGKNQNNRPPRREYLGPELVHDIHEYQKTTKMERNRIFDITGEHFSARFNKEVRSTLPAVWRLYHPFPKRGNIPNQYIYQCKGFRKTWATLRWYRYYVEYKDPYYATKLVGRDMRHDIKNDEIATVHYIACHKMIEAWKYVGKIMPEIIKLDGQQSVYAFVEDPHTRLG